jgi:hypothetical protein
MRTRASGNSTLISRLRCATAWRAILSVLRRVAIRREEDAQWQMGVFSQKRPERIRSVCRPEGCVVLLRRIEHRAMLVAFVQCVVSPFHEDFCPLDERRGQETGEGTDEDFLEEGGVHPIFNSSDGASYKGLCTRRWRFSR